MGWLLCEGCGKWRKDWAEDTANGGQMHECVHCGHQPEEEIYPLSLDDFTASETDTWPCGICGDPDNHRQISHGLATGDGLTRQDIIDYLDGRGFRNGRGRTRTDLALGS